MDSHARAYYAAYEERYRRVYARGVTHWTAFPEELAYVERCVRTFVEAHGLRAGARVIEFGCGEGLVGEILAGMGMDYTGVDLAPSALKRARSRLAKLAGRARVVCADITRLGMFADGAFDAAVDVRCLHMLVVDRDRRRYLGEARRVLRDGGAMLFSGESLMAEPTAEMESLEQWVLATGTDLVSEEWREAWEDGHIVKVRLPRVPARGRTVEEYQREMEAAGFGWIRQSVEADVGRVTIWVWCG